MSGSTSRSRERAVGAARMWAAAALVAVLVAVALTRSTPAPPSVHWLAHLDEQLDTVPSTTWNVEDRTFATNESSYHLARNVTHPLRGAACPGQAGIGRWPAVHLGALEHERQVRPAELLPRRGQGQGPVRAGLVGRSALVATDPTGSGRDRSRRDLRQRGGPTRSCTRRSTRRTDHGTGSVRGEPVLDADQQTRDALAHLPVEKTPGRMRMWVDGNLSVGVLLVPGALVRPVLRGRTTVEPAGQPAGRRLLRPARLEHPLGRRPQRDAVRLRQDLGPE